MAGNNNKQNAALIALLVALAALVYSLIRAVVILYRRSKENPKVARLVHEGLAQGLTEEQIVKAFCDDAEKQMSRTLKQSEIHKIERLVQKEKNIAI